MHNEISYKWDSKINMVFIYDYLYCVCNWYKHTLYIYRKVILYSILRVPVFWLLCATAGHMQNFPLEGWSWLCSKKSRTGHHGSNQKSQHSRGWAEEFVLQSDALSQENNKKCWILDRILYFQIRSVQLIANYLFAYRQKVKFSLVSNSYVSRDDYELGSFYLHLWNAGLTGLLHCT